MHKLIRLKVTALLRDLKLTEIGIWNYILTVNWNGVETSNGVWYVVFYGTCYF
jgi:hypothetical protein